MKSTTSSAAPTNSTPSSASSWRATSTTPSIGSSAEAAPAPAGSAALPAAPAAPAPAAPAPAAPAPAAGSAALPAASPEMKTSFSRPRPSTSRPSCASRCLTALTPSSSLRPPSPWPTASATSRRASDSTAPANSSSLRTSTTNRRPSSTSRRTCPTRATPNFSAQATGRIRQLLEITRGRAFCLFTSLAQMQQVHDALLGQLSYPMLLQGSAPKTALIEQFRATPNAVLFATSSFWQGVDVQGEQLSCSHHRQNPLRRSQRPNRSGPGPSHRRRRRQQLFRLLGPRRRHHPQARFRTPHPLPQRSRPARAHGQPHPQETIWPSLRRKPPRLHPHHGYPQSRRVLRLRISPLCQVLGASEWSSLYATRCAVLSSSACEVYYAD